MSQTLFKITILSAILFGSCLCWVDITSDAVFKSALTTANTNYVATFVLMYHTRFYCPIVRGQSAQNKVILRELFIIFFSK
jgi:hypothetical protein